MEVISVTFASACHAQSVAAEDEYKKLIKVDQGIQQPGANPFSENISLYNGTRPLEQTEVSLSENGPTIAFKRSLSTAGPLGYSLNASRPFGDWELDIPRIETTLGEPATARSRPARISNAAGSSTLLLSSLSEG
ncbi:MAG TPA: hypothetical protein VGC19_00765 [Rhodanobacter sp.]